MRQRWTSLRRDRMARSISGADGASLSPRVRSIGGWLAALLLLGAVAVTARILGGNGDGAAVLPSASSGAASASAGARAAAPIAFGTAIDPVTGEVASETATTAFGPAEAFAYSAAPAEPPPTTILVEVRRTAGGEPETVQPPSPQTLPDGAQVIAFVVPAANLIAEFGTGEFTMLIYAAADSAPIAEGTFTLSEPTAASPSAGAPATP